MHPAIKYAEQIAYSSKEVLHFTYDMAVKYKDVPNTCMVEAGVAAGAQIIALMAGSEFKVPVYALDSFAGIPLPSNRDDQYPGIRKISKDEQSKLPNPGQQVLESSGATVVSEGEFWHNIDTAFGQRKHNARSVKGWFENTLPSFQCPPISVLRLDGDLYNSTYVCLKYLYPKVIKGGCVLIDDFALPGCRAAVLDYFGMSVPKINLMHSGESTIAYWERKHAGRK